MAARDAAAKQARASGDRALAAAIKALRRPSVAAWYVNLAARAPLVSLREWLALGASLREAQSRLDMAAVRALGAGRAALEDRVVRDLAAHLAALGVPVSAPALEEVRATLRAALADADAAARVGAGRLDRALSYGGFGEVDVSAALATMAAAGSKAEVPEPEDASHPEPDSESQPEPEAEPEPQPDPALVAAAREARERRDRAVAALAVAQRELREARARLADAERELAASEQEVGAAEAALAP